MTEQKSAERFSHDVDILLQSRKGPEITANHEAYNQTMQLAAQITKMDYSGESKIKQILKERLLAKLAEGAQDELSDSELDLAAGGLGAHHQQQLLCPKCGASLRGSHCPACRYQR